MNIAGIARISLVGLLIAAWTGLTAAAEPGQKAATEKAVPTEMKVKPEDLPKAVLAALKSRFSGLEITTAVKESEAGNIVYDIELTQKGRKFESDIKEDGTILEVEKEVDPKNYPQALHGAVEARIPKGKITIVMEVNLVKDKKETPDHLEVTVETPDKKEQELLFKLDGKTEFKEPAAAAAAK